MHAQGLRVSQCSREVTALLLGRREAGVQKRDDREWACVPESATLKRCAASGREAERIYASGEAEKVMGKGCGEGGSPMVPPDCGEGSGGQGVRRESPYFE